MVENLLFWVVENIIFWVVEYVIFWVVENRVFWVYENMVFWAVDVIFSVVGNMALCENMIFWVVGPFLEGGIHAFGWSFLLIVWWLEPVVTPVGLKVL